MAPTGASVSVEMNMPMAARPSSDNATNTAARPIRNVPAASDNVSPDSVVTPPIGKRMEPAISPAIATANVATKQKMVTVVALMTSSRVRPTGRDSRYRSAPRFASPATASPATIPPAMGRKNGSATVTPTRGPKTPLLVIWSKKRGPDPGLGPSPERRTATATAIGTAASTSSNTRVRTRRNSSPMSASHIESLSGQRHEGVFEAAAVGRQAANSHARHHQRAVALFGSLPVELGGDDLAGDDDRLQPETVEHLGGVPGVLGLDAQHRVAPTAEVLDRALRDDLAHRDDDGVGAEALHLAEEVGGQEHGRAFGSQLANEVADLACPLWVHAVRGLVQHEQAPGPEERGRQTQSLLHAERVGAAPLARGGAEADFGQGVVDARGARLALAVGPGGVDTPQVLTAREPRIERRSLDERPDLRRHGEAGGGHRLPQETERARGGPDQPEQHPDRRGLARPVRPEEPVHTAARHGEIDLVHDRGVAETLREPGGLDREVVAHVVDAICVAADSSPFGVTAPATIGPLSRMSRLKTGVSKSRPVPYGPLTGLAVRPRFSNRHPLRPGRATTSSQPSPRVASRSSVWSTPLTDCTSSTDRARSRCCRSLFEKFGVAMTFAPSATFASGGGWNARFDAAGRLKSIEVNLLSIATVPLRVCTATFNGTPLAASTPITISVTSDVGVSGIKASW